MKIRGYLALGIICVAFPLCDIFQRTAIALVVRVRPSVRLRVMGWWINRMRALVAWSLERVGGASIPMPERVVPSGPGTLVVMNHQSVLDILLVVGTVRGGYPRIVTRARYRRYIPLISHMVRLYQYPVVDPEAKSTTVQESLRALGEAARSADVPIALFPEGTRTRDGEIGKFRRRGLAAVLSQRDWTVHLFVSDGYWRTARFKDFARGMAHVEGRTEYLGALRWEDPGADVGPFVRRVRQVMVDGLADMRAGRPIRMVEEGAEA